MAIDAGERKKWGWDWRAGVTFDSCAVFCGLRRRLPWSGLREYEPFGEGLCGRDVRRNSRNGGLGSKLLLILFQQA